MPIKDILAVIGGITCIGLCIAAIVLVGYFIIIMTMDR